MINSNSQIPLNLNVNPENLVWTFSLMDSLPQARMFEVATLQDLQNLIDFKDFTIDSDRLLHLFQFWAEPVAVEPEAKATKTAEVVGNDPLANDDEVAAPQLTSGYGDIASAFNDALLNYVTLSKGEFLELYQEAYGQIDLSQLPTEFLDMPFDELFSINVDDGIIRIVNITNQGDSGGVFSEGLTLAELGNVSVTLEDGNVYRVQVFVDSNPNDLGNEGLDTTIGEVPTTTLPTVDSEPPAPSGGGGGNTVFLGPAVSASKIGGVGSGSGSGSATVYGVLPNGPDGEDPVTKIVLNGITFTFTGDSFITAQQAADMNLFTQGSLEVPQSAAGHPAIIAQDDPVTINGLLLQPNTLIVDTLTGQFIFILNHPLDFGNDLTFEFDYQVQYLDLSLFDGSIIIPIEPDSPSGPATSIITVNAAGILEHGSDRSDEPEVQNQPFTTQTNIFGANGPLIVDGKPQFIGSVELQDTRLDGATSVNKPLTITETIITSDQVNNSNGKLNETDIGHKAFLLTDQSVQVQYLDDNHQVETVTLAANQIIIDRENGNIVQFLNHPELGFGQFSQLSQQFLYTVVAGDGQTANANFYVHTNQDRPEAVDFTATVASAASSTVTGYFVAGNGTFTDPDSTFGANGIGGMKINGVTLTGDYGVLGAYGNLFVHYDPTGASIYESFVYEVDPGRYPSNVALLEDVFSFTLIDSLGYESTANMTIQIEFPNSVIFNATYEMSLAQSDMGGSSSNNDRNDNAVYLPDTDFFVHGLLAGAVASPTFTDQSLHVVGLTGSGIMSGVSALGATVDLMDTLGSFAYGFSPSPVFDAPAGGVIFDSFQFIVRDEAGDHVRTADVAIVGDPLAVTNDIILDPDAYSGNGGFDGSALDGDGKGILIQDNASYWGTKSMSYSSIESSTDGITYTVQAFGTSFILDFAAMQFQENGTFEIFNLTGDPDNYIRLTLSDGHGRTTTEIVNIFNIAPVILDLDGDGKVELMSGKGSGITTGDLFHNNSSTAIGWAGAGEGILFYDPTHSGEFNDIHQIAFTGYTPGAKTDLEGLRSFDTSHDGKLDASDKAFGDFFVWQDGNSNAVVDANELKSLSDHQITSLHLESDHNKQSVAGNTVHGLTMYETADGKSHAAADVTLGIGKGSIDTNSVLSDHSTGLDFSTLNASSPAVVSTQAVTLSEPNHASNVDAGAPVPPPAQDPLAHLEQQSANQEP